MELGGIIRKGVIVFYSFQQLPQRKLQKKHETREQSNKTRLKRPAITEN